MLRLQPKTYREINDQLDNALEDNHVQGYLLRNQLAYAKAYHAMLTITSKDLRERYKTRHTTTPAKLLELFMTDLAEMKADYQDIYDRPYPDNLAETAPHELILSLDDFIAQKQGEIDGLTDYLSQNAKA